MDEMLELGDDGSSTSTGWIKSTIGMEEERLGMLRLPGLVLLGNELGAVADLTSLSGLGSSDSEAIPF